MLHFIVQNAVSCCHEPDVHQWENLTFPNWQYQGGQVGTLAGLAPVLETSPGPFLLRVDALLIRAFPSQSKGANTVAKANQGEDSRRPVLIEYLDKPGEGEEPSDEELAFVNFQTEFAESDSYAKITVYRQPTGPGNRPGQKKLVFLFECGIDEFTYSQLLSRLRDEYGSGTYRLQARMSDGQMKFNRAVEIEKSPTSPMAKRDPESVAELMKGFQEMMAAQAERTEQLIGRFRTEPAKPALDPMQAMAGTMALFTQMLAAMTPLMAGRASGGDDLLGSLEKLAKIKELFGGFGDGGGSETNFYDVVGRTLETLKPIIPLALAKAQGLGAPPVMIDQHISATPAQPEPVPMASPIKRQVDMLVAQAAAGADPTALAGTILNMTPEDKLDELHAFISKPDVVDTMASVNSGVNLHRAFFETLRTALLAGTEETSEPS